MCLLKNDEQIKMKKDIPWDLLISHLKQESSVEEETALTQWRRKAGENEAFYRDIVSLWDDIRRDSAAYNPDTEYCWKQLKARLNRMEKEKAKRLSLPLRKTCMAVAAASILLFILLNASYRIGKERSQPETGFQTCMAINGKTQVILPDGSLVWLNLGSALTYETSFLRHREITLDGEALFDVRKDSKHPFTVKVGDVQVKVFGTRFNVRARPADADIRVALLEGNVRVSAGEQALDISPGEIASFDRQTHRLSAAGDDVAFESCWANSTCTFEAKSLGHICKYLERWYNVDIRVDPSIAESQVYTFTVTDEPLETVLRIMSTINPLRYSFGEDRTVTIKHVKPSKK
jgi:ferric-dicitrate binding protein FerR (iron transport regulator)